MGFDGIYSIYHRNEKTQKYEKLSLYDKNGKELYDFFPSRDGMLNQLLLGYNRHGYDFDAIGARRGIPDWYVDLLKEKHPDWFDKSDGSWSYNVDEGTYYDYLELRGWAQGNVCEHSDWMADYEDEDNPPKRNALKDFMRLVNIYLELYNIWCPKPGEIIIVCEMSY